MNLDFYSAGNSTIKGLQGIAKKTENSRIAQSDGDEKSTRFKDLFNQSKQDISKADRRLETARKNQDDSKVADENEENEADQVTSKTKIKDHETKVDDTQQNETAPKAIQSDGNDDSKLLAVDGMQLMGVPNLQGAIDETQTNLSLNLGVQEIDTTGDLVGQVQSSQLVQTAGGLVADAVSSFDPNQINEAQTLGTDKKTEVTDKNSDLALFPGFVKKVAAEAASGDGLTTQGSSEEVGNQTNSIDNQAIPKTEFQNQQGLDSDNRIQDANSESLKSQSETGGLNAAEGFKDELTKISGKDENILSQIDTQNFDEKGVQGVNASGINTLKGSEIQAHTNIPVVQQVEQKILQNFEANKPMVLQMTLSPENLGDVEVQLKYDQGKLIIDISAVSQETQNLLGKHINQLVRGLALQNVQVETVHLNTPVEASSNGGNSTSLMNSGSDFSQQQNNAQLRESFLRNSSIQNSLLNNGSENVDDGIISIAQNLQYHGQRRINYLV